MRRLLVVGFLFLFALSSSIGEAAPKRQANKWRQLPQPTLDELLACIEKVDREDFGLKRPLKFRYVYGKSGRGADEPDELFMVLYTPNPREAIFWDVFVIEKDGKVIEFVSINEDILALKSKGQWQFTDLMFGMWTRDYSRRAINRVMKTPMQSRAPQLRGKERIPCYRQNGRVW